jgi:hypothetical protein
MLELKRNVLPDKPLYPLYYGFRAFTTETPSHRKENPAITLCFLSLGIAKNDEKKGEFSSRFVGFSSL